jgi:hypothetical protein
LTVNLPIVTKILSNKLTLYSLDPSYKSPTNVVYLLLVLKSQKQGIYYNKILVTVNHLRSSERTITVNILAFKQ